MMNSILISGSFFVSLQHHSHVFHRHFDNGNALLMRSGGFLTMRTAIPLEMTREL